MSDDLVSRYYPEKAVGGYSSVDGTIEFYGRVNALLRPEMRVLDYGAGRGSWFELENPQSWKFRLRDIRSKVDTLVGCDIDPAVTENRSLDEAVVIPPQGLLPFTDEDFDLIVTDFVFEHLDDPEAVASELARVLRPGGWICARTPNRFGYVSILTRLIPNRRHRSVLRKAQPHRHAQDVFPTRFRLNTAADVARFFPNEEFSRTIYYYDAEPSYAFGSRFLFVLMRFVNSVLPRSLRSSLFIFIHKKPRPIA